MSRRVPVLIQRLDPDLPLPVCPSRGCRGRPRGAPRCAPQAGERALVATGVAIALPDLGMPPSSTRARASPARHGVTTLNGPGTVDAGYRGEVQVNLVNLDPSLPFQVRRGGAGSPRLVVQEVAVADLVEVTQAAGHRSRLGGHGHTGGFASTDRQP